MSRPSHRAVALLRASTSSSRPLVSPLSASASSRRSSSSFFKDDSSGGGAGGGTSTSLAGSSSQPFTFKLPPDSSSFDLTAESLSSASTRRYAKRHAAQVDQKAAARSGGFGLAKPSRSGSSRGASEQQQQPKRILPTFQHTPGKKRDPNESGTIYLPARRGSGDREAALRANGAPGSSSSSSSAPPPIATATSTSPSPSWAFNLSGDGPKAQSASVPSSSQPEDGPIAAAPTTFLLPEGQTTTTLPDNNPLDPHSKHYLRNQARTTIPHPSWAALHPSLAARPLLTERPSDPYAYTPLGPSRWMQDLLRAEFKDLSETNQARVRAYVVAKRKAKKLRHHALPKAVKVAKEVAKLEKKMAREEEVRQAVEEAKKGRQEEEEEDETEESWEEEEVVEEEAKELIEKGQKQGEKKSPTLALLEEKRKLNKAFRKEEWARLMAEREEKAKVKAALAEKDKKPPKIEKEAEVPTTPKEK